LQALIDKTNQQQVKAAAAAAAAAACHCCLRAQPPIKLCWLGWVEYGINSWDFLAGKKKKKSIQDFKWHHGTRHCHWCPICVKKTSF